MLQFDSLDTNSSKILLAMTILLMPLLGGLVVLGPDPILIPAFLVAVFLVIIYMTHLHLGLYVLLLTLPLQRLEWVVADLFAVSLFDLALWTWIIAYVIRGMVQRPDGQKSRIYIPILLWWGTNLVSGLAANDISSWAVAVVSRLLSSTTLILTFNVLCQHRRMAANVIKAYIGVAVFVALLGLLQLSGILPSQVTDPISGRTIGIQYGRIGGLLANPNYMLTYVATPMFLALATYLRDRTNHSIYLVAFLVLLVTAVLTFSRSGYVGIIAGFGVFLIDKRNRLSRLVLGAIVIALLTVGLFSLYNQVTAHTNQSGAFERLLMGDRYSVDSSLGRRFDLTEMGIAMFRSSPWIGVGAAQYQNEFWRFLGSSRYEYDLAYNAHNTYLQVLAETGVPGLLSYLLIALIVSLEAFRIRFWHYHRSSAVIGLFSGFVALCVSGLAHNMLRSEMWFVAGLILAYAAIAANDNATTEPSWMKRSGVTNLGTAGGDSSFVTRNHRVGWPLNKA